MRTVLTEAAAPVLGVPTGPLGPAASLSTDAGSAAAPPGPADCFRTREPSDGAAAVLIYCHGELVHVPLIGGGFGQCGCGERVRVIW